ncbi:serine protease [Actinomortierella ambigua]|uniref:Serine protease n=1 Tax=Actinomortierella ambigua TaxID=1343610 RepID=A0A9P6TYZ7_9FUNG|nr:serine protease [Actinomortierella ambigua]
MMLPKLSLVAAAVLATTAVAFPSFEREQRLAPVVTSLDAEAIPDSYIVVFKDGVQASEHSAWVSDLHKRDLNTSGMWDDFVSGVNHVFDMGTFQGLSGRFRPDVLEEIRKNPNVDYIERNQVVYSSAMTTQSRAPWGLARISHRKGLGLSTFNKYIYDTDGGDGVTVYVIDTGVNIKHEEFGGRAKWGKTVPRNDPDQDDNGHGTHCAGTIASDAYGVSKKANIVAVKVLRSNGSGTMEDVISGVDYALKQHQSEAKAQGANYKGSVANMSLGGGKSRALDTAVNRAVKSGLHFAVAAGNDNRDACDYSPAGASEPISVGASNFNDERAYFSNKGKCVDVFAPGQDIKSTWIGSNSASRSISGTSMASPHVAGLIAYFLSLLPKSDSGFHSGALTPAEMKKFIVKRGTKDALKDVPNDTPNVLVFNSLEDDLVYAW